MGPTFRQAVLTVAALNLLYFGVEFSVALAIGSVSLFADSVDFLEDASVNFLILASFAWSARNRARVGMALAGILLIPGVAALWTVAEKVLHFVAPAAVPLTVTGAGALMVNLFCALLLARFRHQGGSLARAAFLSARNDVIANIAIILAGLLTVVVPSAWPDLLVGIGVAVMNADAAREVFIVAKREHAEAKP